MKAISTVEPGLTAVSGSGTFTAFGNAVSEGSRLIPGRSEQTIADAQRQVTVETVEGSVWTVSAVRWCYSLGTVN